MTKENQAQLAVAKARKAIDAFPNARASWTALLSLAEVEVRAEQARQQELANMIDMAANPSACPFPLPDVLARIKELTNLG